MPFAGAVGSRIYYRLEGSASRPLLVLAHSLGTDHGMWDPQMAALLNYFQVLRMDLRGHGASDAPAADYTMAELAGDVLQTVTAARLAAHLHALGIPIDDPEPGALLAALHRLGPVER